MGEPKRRQKEMEEDTYEKTSASLTKSVVAIAIGKTLDGKPNIVGTGFGIGLPECFATCWHVAEVEDNLKKLSKEDLEKKAKLTDATLRIARLVKEYTYEWQEAEEKTWFRTSNKQADICIYRAIGVPVPPLHLFYEEDFPWGAEVGVIGFPMGNRLQGKVIRPFWGKTIIAGGLELKLAGGKETARLALGSAFAGGFSGAPVFLARDGQVVGMVASNTLEIDKSGQIWPAGISLAIPAKLIEHVLVSAMGKTTEVIKDSLRKTLGKK